MRSVEETFTTDGTAKAGDAVGGVYFSLELVVVGKFLICFKSVTRSSISNVWLLTLTDVTQGIDDNAFGVVNSDNLRCAVRCTAVINETRNATHLCCVDNCIFVDTEQVAGPDTLHVIFGFA